MNRTLIALILAGAAAHAAAEGQIIDAVDRTRATLGACEGQTYWHDSKTKVLQIEDPECDITEAECMTTPVITYDGKAHKTVNCSGKLPGRWRVRWSATQ